MKWSFRIAKYVLSRKLSFSSTELDVLLGRPQNVDIARNVIYDDSSSSLDLEFRLHCPLFASEHVASAAQVWRRRCLKRVRG